MVRNKQKAYIPKRSKKILGILDTETRPWFWLPIPKLGFGRELGSCVM